MNNDAINMTWAFDSQFEAAHDAGAQLRALATELGFCEVEIPRIELCVHEAFANAVEHAFGNQPGHRIEVDAIVHGETLEIRICQFGVPLDAAVVTAATVGFDDLEVPLDAFDCEKRGRGLRIIKVIMDTCEVMQSGDRYCLVMRKPLPTHSDQAA